MVLDNPYFILLLIAGAISLSLAFFAWRRRTSPGATPLVFLMVATAVWQIGYAFELAGSEESTKVLWAKIGYLGIVTVPTAWVAFTLEYTGRGHWLTRRNLALLALVPVVTLLLAWTNEAHGLIWREVRLESAGSFSAAEFVHGGWFWAFGAYSYLLLVLGIIFLADALLHSPHLYWKQAAALLVSVMVPWATNWSFGVGLTPVSNLDLTAPAFVISGIVLAWALARTRLLDITPVARKTVFENMADGVLVLDSLDRVVDCNAAAQRIIGDSGASFIGRPIAQIWPDGPDILQRSTDSGTERPEIALVLRGEQRTYDVAASSIYDGRGRPTGRVILFHDTTETRRSQEESERLFVEVSASRERLRALSQRLVEVQEAERRHLALELHDEIGQALTGLKLTLEKGTHLRADAPGSSLDEAQAQIDGLIDQVRQMSLDLRPGMLDDLGLLPALLWYFERYTAQTNISIAFSHDGPQGRFQPEVETAAYRIAQEALTNIARHAGVSEAIVRVSANENTLRLYIEDEGTGFDPDIELSAGNSSGLAGMRERAALLGGRLSVDSAPNAGARLWAELPLGHPVNGKGK